MAQQCVTDESAVKIGANNFAGGSSMAVKSKGGSAALKRSHQPGPPKTTSIGQGAHSRPRRRGKKKMVGQGKP